MLAMCIICFIVMAIGFIIAGYGMKDLESSSGDDGARGAFFGLLLGIFFGVGGLVFYTETMVNTQKERAVEAGYGEYSKKGVRTINKDIRFIISGNAMKEKK